DNALAGEHMANGRLSAVLGRLHRLIGPRAASPDSDRHLLERFAASRDEAAFTELVRRHGPMVLGVCRRVLRHAQDAEDAFQATFLVLATKAGSPRWEESVARWLYEVAFRVAHKARVGAARRRARERQATAMAQAEPGAGEAWDDLREVLDEEVNRLPCKYRSPVVLCYLEGKTNTEAARELGWTKGTVSGRLARARDLLRTRLARRGVPLPTAATAALLPGRAPALPSPLVSATVRAALTHAPLAGVSAQTAALVRGVLREMARSRLKVLAA